MKRASRSSDRLLQSRYLVMSSWNPDRLPQSLSYYNTNVFGMSGASRTPVVSGPGAFWLSECRRALCVQVREREGTRRRNVSPAPSTRPALLRPTDNGRSRRRPCRRRRLEVIHPIHRSSLILRKRTSTPFAHLWNSGLARPIRHPSGCSLPPPSRFDSQCKAAPRRPRRDSCHGGGRGRQGWPRRSVAVEPSSTFRTGA